MIGCYRYKNNSRGQTLVEAIIALTVLVVIITAIAALTLNSISNSIFLRSQDTANKFAQEGMDFLSTQKKQDYTTFSAMPNDNYCLSYSSSRNPQWPLVSGSGAACLNSNTTFTHEVNILSGGCVTAGVVGIQVTLSVGWTDSKCLGGAYCHRAKLQSCFTNSSIINPNPLIP